MGDLLDATKEDVGTVPACRTCGSERVLRYASACWNRDDGLWELEQVFDRAHCPACKAETELIWRDADGARPVQRIRELNDLFRTTGQGLGTVLITRGIEELGPDAVLCIMGKVRTYTAFTPENDPWGEHDFGRIDVNGEIIYWKIVYYDLDRRTGSPNPANPAVTFRVLTVLLANEY